MNRAYWIIAGLLVAGSWVLAASLYQGLPQRVPTHWNWEGKVDGWGNKSWATFLMPGMMTIMLVFFVFLPALSPRHFEVDRFRSTYLYIMAVMMGLFAYMNVMILLATWQEVHQGPKLFDIGRALIAGVFLFIALIGNVMGKVRRNFYIGIRVPWTLASDRVWDDTHRLAAWLMVAGGLIGFLMVIVRLPVSWSLGVLIVTMCIPVLYSFVHYKRLERQGVL